jgi:hypothetical protein
MDLRKLGSIFWVGLAIIYCVVWFYLDEWGVVQLFAENVVQPFLPPERDAYTGVTILGWIVLSVMGGPALAKGK